MRSLGMGLLMALAVGVSSPLAAQNSTNASAIEGILGTCRNIIDAGNQATKPDLFFRCREIVILRTTDAGADAAAIVTRDELGAAGRNATESAAGQAGNLSLRMASVRSGAVGLSVGNLQFDGEGRLLPADLLLAQLSVSRGGAASADQGQDDSGDLPDGMGSRRLGIFINGDVGFGDRDPGTEDVGFDFDSVGVTLGLDYRFSDSFFGGVALGLSETENDLTGDGRVLGNGSGTLDVEGQSFSLYASKVLTEKVYLDGSVSYGINDYDSATNIVYDIARAAGDPLGPGTTSVRQVATGDTEGDSLSASIALGHDQVYGANSLQTVLRVNFMDLGIDAYREQMSDPGGLGGEMALEVFDQDIESLSGHLELTFAHAKSADWGIFIPQVRGGVVHEFSDDPRQVRTRLVEDPNIGQSNVFFDTGPCLEGCDKNLIVFTDPADSDFFTLGVGFSAVFKGGNQAFLFWDTVLGRGDLTYNVITGGFRFEL